MENSVFLTSLHRQCNPYQNDRGVHHRTRKYSSKIYAEPHKTPNSPSRFEQKEQNRLYDTIWLQNLIQTLWRWHQNRHVPVDQWNRMKNMAGCPCMDNHLIFDRGTKNMYWRKDIFFNKRFWENRYPHAKEWSRPSSFTSYKD